MRAAVRALARGAALMAVTLLAGTAPGTEAPAAPGQIVIKGFMFMPDALTVKTGASVTWVNRDDEPHTVVSDAGLFRSGAVDTGESFVFNFERPGTYHFTCSIHPRMVGTIVVTGG